MELTKLREKLDSLDEEIVKLFEERMEVCKAVAEYKKKVGKPVLDEQREAAKIKQVRELSENGMQDYVEELFKEIMRLSRKLQQKF